jgi:hypothetical protein
VKRHGRFNISYYTALVYTVLTEFVKQLIHNVKYIIIETLEYKSVLHNDRNSQGCIQKIFSGGTTMERVKLPLLSKIY